MNAQNENIILDIRNLTCGYGAEPVIENFNLQIKAGETIAITGPNGSGKSTLLKAIYQLCKIDSGEIFYKGNSLIGKTPEQIKRYGIAYFMQKNSIFTSLSVRENIMLSLNGLRSEGKASKIEEIMDAYPQFKNRMNKSAGLLSGGERQQLAMIMLLSQGANLWLLDEPTAGLNQENTELFIRSISLAKNNISIILVEHKTQVVNKLTNRIVKF